jgi:hypothetical protein
MYADPSGYYDGSYRLDNGDGTNFVNTQTSKDVAEVQKALEKLGYLNTGGHYGYFGNLTEAAVNKYKADNHLSNTGSNYGVVGGTTWSSIQDDLNPHKSTTVTSGSSSSNNSGGNLGTTIVNGTKAVIGAIGNLFGNIFGGGGSSTPSTTPIPTKAPAQVQSTPSGNGNIGSTGTVQNGVNPTKQQVIYYITQEATKLGVPVQLALATAWTENSFQQYDSSGKAGPNASNDYGLMQINICHKIHYDKNGDLAGELNQQQWDEILNSWEANVDFGLNYLKSCYNDAKKSGEGDNGPYSKDENLARSAYSIYNSGSAYFRYRTTYNDAKSTFAGTKYAKYIEGYYNGPRDVNGYDKRDIRFGSIYEKKKWND